MPLSGTPDVEKLRARRDVKGLVKGLEDEDLHVRIAAAGALGAIGDARAVEPLIATLKDSDWHARFGAARALGKIGDMRAVEPLIATLKDNDLVVCAAAAAVLGGIGQPAVEPLTAALGDSDAVVRSGAAWALGEIGDVRAVEPLIVALNDNDWNVSFSAAAALGKIGDARAVEPLIAVLDGGIENVRPAAAESLGKIGDLWAIEPLIAALKYFDGCTRQVAARSLGKMRDTRAIEPLVAATYDNDRGVSQAAAAALDRLGWKPGSLDMSWFLRCVLPRQFLDAIARYDIDVAQPQSGRSRTDELLEISQVVRSRIDEFLNALWVEENVIVPKNERKILLDRVFGDLEVGWGPLEPILIQEDPEISEILCNGFETISIKRKGKVEPVPIHFESDKQYRRTIDHILALSGRQPDETSPVIETQAHDGSTIIAALPLTAARGPILSIRTGCYDCRE
jgi:HEAT repeat protein